jgi:quercetin dioxygenase-like cupin family protein
MATPKTSATVVNTVDLAPDLPSYQLRLRHVVCEPGSMIGIHSHQDRPAFSDILAGTFTVGAEGGDMREYKPGAVIT